MSLTSFLAENGYEASAVMYALGLDPFLVERVDAGQQYLPAPVCEAIARYTSTDTASVIGSCGGVVTAPNQLGNAPTYFFETGGFKSYPPQPVALIPQVNPASAQALPSASSQIPAMIVTRTIPSP